MSMNGGAFAMAEMNPYTSIAKITPLPSRGCKHVAGTPYPSPLVAASAGGGLPFVGVVGDDERRFGVFYIHTLALGMLAAARPQAYVLTLGIFTRVASDEVIVACVDGICIGLVAVGILPGRVARGQKPAKQVAAAGDVPARAASVALATLRDICTAYLGVFAVAAEPRLRKLAKEAFGRVDDADRLPRPFTESITPMQLYWPLLFACYFGHRAVPRLLKKAAAAYLSCRFPKTPTTPVHGGKCTGACGAGCAAFLAARIARIAGPAQFYTLSGFMYPLQPSASAHANGGPPPKLEKMSEKEMVYLSLCALDAELAYILQMGHGVPSPQWSTIVPAELWAQMLPGTSAQWRGAGQDSFNTLCRAHAAFFEEDKGCRDDLAKLAGAAVKECYEGYKRGCLADAPWSLKPLVAAYADAVSLSRLFDAVNFGGDIGMVARFGFFSGQEVRRLRFVTYDARAVASVPLFEGMAHMQASYPYNYPVLALGPARLCRSSCLHSLKDHAVEKWQNDSRAANVSGLAVHPGTGIEPGDELTVWYHCHYRGSFNEECNCTARCASAKIVADELKNVFESST